MFVRFVLFCVFLVSCCLRVVVVLFVCCCAVGFVVFLFHVVSPSLLCFGAAASCRRCFAVLFCGSLVPCCVCSCVKGSVAPLLRVVLMLYCCYCCCVRSFCVVPWFPCLVLFAYCCSVICVRLCCGLCGFLVSCCFAIVDVVFFVVCICVASCRVCCCVVGSVLSCFVLLLLLL